MSAVGRVAGIVLGVGAGVVSTMFYLGQPRPAGAASTDRYQDTILATGAVSINPRIQTDGVWLLDYKTGKLLGTVIDRNQGKIVGWAEVDLRTEYNVVPQQDVHFLMTTGYITQGQSALYLAETTTGQFGVYTLGPGPNGVIIRRHDMTTFRAQPPAGGLPPAGVAPQPAPGGLPGAGLPPGPGAAPLPAVGAGPLPSPLPPPPVGAP